MTASDALLSLLRRTPGSGAEFATIGVTAADLSRLETVLSIKLSRPVSQFLAASIPSMEVGPGFADFQSFDGIIVENTKRFPGIGAIKAGMLIFAVAGDGGGYAVDVENGEVCLLPVGQIQEDSIDSFRRGRCLALTGDNLRLVAEQRWPSLEAFALWLEQQVES